MLHVGNAGGGRILVDPGALQYDPKFLDDWARTDAVLITHWHVDHFNHDAIKQINAPVYATAEAAKKYPDIKITIVKPGDKLELAPGIIAQVTNAFHGYNPWLKGPLEVEQTVGYMIAAEGKKIYFTGDTICFKNEYKCDVLCAPVSGYGLTMSPFEVALFANECGAELVLPCHMDNPKYPVETEKVQSILSAHETNCRVLKPSEFVNV
ncbi:MAG: MBL fold metallo-hydrolase [Alphaproteobacteria bacterium]|nr:MBL fold metallo-hydrolase [Alphaproteobacteria bacterium]